MARITNATEPNQPKLGERWLKGAWLGRRAEDNAHLALTERGLIHARAVKALPEAERFERARYSSLRWVEQAQGNPEPLESFWAVLGKTLMLQLQLWRPDLTRDGPDPTFHRALGSMTESNPIPLECLCRTSAFTQEFPQLDNCSLSVGVDCQCLTLKPHFFQESKKVSNFTGV